MACGPITGIFGTNSSGKTSLIQFLLLLKQTKDATDRGTSLELNGEWVELGTIQDAVHNHDLTRLIEAEITVGLPRDLQLHDPGQGRSGLISTSSELKLEFQIGVEGNVPRARSLAYELGPRRFSLKPKNGDLRRFDLSTESLADDASEFRFLRTRGRAWELPGPIRSYSFPDQARTYYQNAGFLSDLETAFENALDRIYYLGPLRDYPRRDYLWARSRPTDVGKKGQNAIDAILSATEAEEKRNLKKRSPRKPFQEIIAHWLKELGLIERFEVKEIAPGSNRWQAWVQTKKMSKAVLLTDVGFGVSQVLPVITLLQFVPEGSTVILEQPEIHLHPLAQAGLADVIIQAATHRKVQVILESHSEHLLLRLQRRIAEKRLPADDVKLYFCDIPRNCSVLTPLELDLFGRIENWPDRFMGDAFSETAEAEIARLNRQQAAE